MPDLVKPFVEAVVIIAVLIALTRVQGLRSFSKMSSFDFAVTVSVGSVVASIVLLPDQHLGIGIAALVALFGVQIGLSRLRVRLPWLRRGIDNTPLLLMRDGRILEDNLLGAQISRGDLMGKLRAANVLRLDQVRAVVLEPTGDVSVLHSAEGTIDDALLDGVAHRT